MLWPIGSRFWRIPRLAYAGSPRASRIVWREMGRQWQPGGLLYLVDAGPVLADMRGRPLALGRQRVVGADGAKRVYV